MLSLIPFTVCAFLALITSNGGNATPSTIPLQCSANGVCAALETLTRSQDRLRKTLNLCTDGENMITNPIIALKKEYFIDGNYTVMTTHLKATRSSDKTPESAKYKTHDLKRSIV
ncbi:putative skeletal organic matrix protein 7 [Acropora cervicornis]|uniref:Skeletal organic matrix protein 7 n=1 Tax=Acropora cervicornis TaxID=6130 RepID=A0AAD9PVV4_ACRCE|nr:putative skeletal organic matrix protein 7 [Acropora cervicornis]